MYPFIETIRIEDGQIYNLDYHTERFNETRTTRSFLIHSMMTRRLDSYYQE